MITSHIRPDGDAVGSLAALKSAIETAARQQNRDCAVQLLLLSNPATNYRFLVPSGTWLFDKDLTRQQVDNGYLDRFDLIIVVDTSALRQLDYLADYLQKRTEKALDSPLMVIDHHLSGDPIGSCRVINSEASAAGEIVFDLIQYARWPITEIVAGALLAAIGTDTGWFCFQNTTARVFQIAAELVNSGIKPCEIYRKLYQNDPPERLYLKAEALKSMELYCQGRLAVMQITREMLKKSGAKRSHIENIVNEPQNIGSVLAVALLVELEDGQTRCSLRSKDLLDVNILAGKFGGGGHARAAGVTIPEKLPTAREKIVAAMSEAINKLTP